jgi:hypothetical protein
MAEGSPDRVGLAFGVAFIVAGVLFLLDRLDVLDLKVSYVIPILLIVLGLSIVILGRPKSPPAG